MFKVSKNGARIAGFFTVQSHTHIYPDSELHASFHEPSEVRVIKNGRNYTAGLGIQNVKVDSSFLTNICTYTCPSSAYCATENYLASGNIKASYIS
jgi:hypothetical protein